MTYRVRAGRATILALAAILAGSSIAAAAPPKGSFTAPVRLGFPNGDDWEPSIAADRFGHVYAFWTHYIGYGGAATGDPTRPVPTAAARTWISRSRRTVARPGPSRRLRSRHSPARTTPRSSWIRRTARRSTRRTCRKIGRASCRERV